jgi:hypothetical protein
MIGKSCCTDPQQASKRADYWVELGPSQMEISQMLK